MAASCWVFNAGMLSDLFAGCVLLRWRLVLLQLGTQIRIFVGQLLNLHARAECGYAR